MEELGNGRETRRNGGQGKESEKSYLSYLEGDSCCKKILRGEKRLNSQGGKVRGGKRLDNQGKIISPGEKNSKVIRENIKL